MELILGAIDLTSSAWMVDPEKTEAPTFRRQNRSLLDAATDGKGGR